MTLDEYIIEGRIPISFESASVGIHYAYDYESYNVTAFYSDSFTFECDNHIITDAHFVLFF